MNIYFDITNLKEKEIISVRTSLKLVTEAIEVLNNVTSFNKTNVIKDLISSTKDLESLLEGESICVEKDENNNKKKNKKSIKKVYIS